MAIKDDWYLVSSHGSILFYVAANPDCTNRDISEATSRSPRTVWGIIGDLRRAGMLHVRKDGHHHHYTVNLDAPFRHPILGGFTLRPVLGSLVKQGRRR